MRVKQVSKRKPTMHDCIYMAMSRGHWWTPEELKFFIANNFKKSCGESGLTAGMRDFRKQEYREKYKLPLDCEVLEKKRAYGKSNLWKYRLVITRSKNV